MNVAISGINTSHVYNFLNQCAGIYLGYPKTLNYTLAGQISKKIVHLMMQA